MSRPGAPGGAERPAAGTGQPASVKRAIRPCPRCGSENVRLSRTRSFAEKIRAFAGIQPVRCRDCSHRFSDYPWRWPDVYYARCPLCASMLLRDWTERYYYPPFYKRWLTYVGWKQQRCEICRVNFVSLRPRWNPKKRQIPR